MGSGQPYVKPAAFAWIPGLLAALLAAACGSTSVTDLTGPDDSRCAASITVDPPTVAAAGGPITVSVASERDCTWSADSEASWLAVRSASGQGSGSFTATAAANEQPVSRTGTISVNSQRVTITQQGRACTFTLQGPDGPLPATGGAATIQVTGVSGCSWTATSSAPWLVLRTATGSGSGLVRFDLAPNTGPEREASITVGGETLVIAQAAVGPACSFTIDPSMQLFTVAGGSAQVSVTAVGAGCPWTVTGDADWITIVTSSGTGTGQATYTVSPNPSFATRQATLTIAGRVHTITQEGVACTLALTPDAGTFTSAGGSGTVQLDTPVGCLWMATSNAGWVTVQPPSGAGPAMLSYTVQANVLPEARTARITAGGSVHTITQEAATVCTYALEPPAADFAADAGPGLVHVNTQPACAWTAVSTATWIVVDPAAATGAGSADIPYTVEANTGAARSGAIDIAGQSHLVTQAAPCTFTLEPESVPVGAGGGAGSVHVTTAATCTWTATSNAEWIAVTTGSGTGTADVGYTVAANPGPEARSGTISVNGQLHTVTQAAGTTTTP